MKHIDGERVEHVLQEVYGIFKIYNVTGNEGSAIAGMILTDAASNATVTLLEKNKGK